MRTPLSRNRYAFVNENPVNRNDVYGFATVEELNKEKDKYTNILDPIQKQLDAQKANLSSAITEADRLYWVRNDTVKNAYNAKTAYDNANNLKSIANYLGLQGWIMQQINNNVSNTKANYDNANQAFWTANSNYVKAVGNVGKVNSNVQILTSTVDGLKKQIEAINNEIDKLQPPKVDNSQSSSGDALTNFVNDLNKRVDIAKKDIQKVWDNKGNIIRNIMKMDYAIRNDPIGAVKGAAAIPVRFGGGLVSLAITIRNLENSLEGKTAKALGGESIYAQHKIEEGERIANDWNNTFNTVMKSLGVDPNRQDGRIVCTFFEGNCNFVQDIFGDEEVNASQAVYDIGNAVIEWGIVKDLIESLGNGSSKSVASDSKVGAETLNNINQSSTAVLKNGYYEVNGVKFSEYYYEKLWTSGRKAPSLITNSILDSDPIISADKLLGFNRYEALGWEMVYNPSTKEVWHLQPIK